MNVDAGLSAKLNSIHEYSMISVEETSVGIGCETRPPPLPSGACANSIQTAECSNSGNNRSAMENIFQF